MAEFGFLRWSLDGHVGTVWLDRPRLTRSTSRCTARPVVLIGQGKHFCGGNDLKEFQTMDPANAGERMRQVREAFWAIYDAPLPVITAVHGVAVGTGLALAASCDLIVAAEGAKLGAPETTSG